MAPIQHSTQPWVEKYRPKQVTDVVHQEEVVRALCNTLETGNLPHLLFYGPPGTGKTTTALAIAHQLFGPEQYKSRVLELNASDDRGINVVRTKIKDFAAIAVGSSSTSRIIEPLASRCAKFRFKPLVEDIMNNRILHICKEEGLHLDSDALNTLGSVCEGDLRRAITCLQSAARLYGSSISSDNIISVSGIVPNQVVQSLFQACKTGQFDVLQKEATDIIAEGYPVSQVFSQLFDIIVQVDDVSDETKARISQRLAEADKCLVDGADEYLQLLDVSSNTMRALCNMPQECCY